MRGLLHCPPLVRFICVRMWGHGVLPTALPALLSATLSPALSVYLCANVGPQCLLVLGLPAPFAPHSASLGPPRPRESSPPRCPSPPLLPVWRNVYFVFPGVEPPCWSILCQFWLCEEVQCVYLRLHLGSPSLPSTFQVEEYSSCFTAQFLCEHRFERTMNSLREQWAQRKKK